MGKKFYYLERKFSFCIFFIKVCPFLVSRFSSAARDKSLEKRPSTPMSLVYEISQLNVVQIFKENRKRKIKYYSSDANCGPNKLLFNLLNVSISAKIHQISPVNKLKSCKSWKLTKDSQNQISRRLKLKCFEKRQESEEREKTNKNIVKMLKFIEYDIQMSQWFMSLSLDSQE